MEELQEYERSWIEERQGLRLIGSNFISFFGDQMYVIALPLIVLALTGSPLQMGIIAALERLPVLLQPLAGVLTDRMNRRTLLWSGDIGRFVLMGGLGVLAITDLLHMAFLYFGALLIGIMTQIYQTAQFATLPRVVHKNHLPLFNSMNTGMLQTAILLGPALAGLLISIWSPGVGLILNSLTFLIALILIRTIPQDAPPKNRESTVWEDVKEGAAFVLEKKPIFYTNLAMFFSIFGTTLFLTMMIVHVKLLAFSSIEIGWFVSIGGAGALLGALSVNAIKPKVSARVLLFSAGVTGAVSIILFSLYDSFWMLSLMNAIGAGMASMKSPAIVTIRQQLTPPRLHGRVQATSRWMTWLLMPVAALCSGLFAEWIGTEDTIMIGGIIALLASFIYLHPSLKSV
ncbi:MFS transporter [Halobacillus salinus]|uniref:MFS transporter n=1 Tax=Halobacillus salinus TaxID=192814 RepID=UPI0009A8DD83|nr:MFS transporter [Halobacillus salinus]